MDSPATRRFSARHGEFDSIVAFIQSACASLKDDERLRIILLVEELFANSVNHGYGGDCDEPVWLTLGVGADDCHLVYEDQAPAYDPFASEDASNMQADLVDRPIGGLGIVLMMELSSSRRYERRGERNVIELHVPCTFRH